MANIEVKLRRGTTSQHGSFTGAEGEVTVDTDKDTVVVHDGSTVGGHELAKTSDAYTHPNHTGDVTSTGDGATVIAANAVTPAKISSTDALLNVNDTHQTIGLGILANASSSFPKVKMDGGVQVGDQAPTLTSINSELSVTGNGNLNLLTVENTSTTSTDQSVVVVKGPVPTLQLNDTVAPTDQGVMNLNMTDGELRFTQISDDTLTTTDLVKIKPDEMTVENGTGVAKIKIINTSSSGGGASLKLKSNVAVATNEGDYSIFIGGANGKFNIKNELADKTINMDASGDWYAFTNTQDLGKTGSRWDDVWSAGTFNGSDQNIKQDIEELDEAEKRVAVKCKGLIKKYRLKDAVAKKGDDARIHVGIIAQELQAAFESEGLDAFRYSMIGKDTWWEGTDSEGNRDVKYEATDGYAEVTQMSVRYNELLAFIIAAM